MKDRYEELANAIIKQAAEDYRDALRHLKRNPGYPEARRSKSDLERFFRSAWFAKLTDINGEWLIEALCKEAASHESKRISESGI